MPDDPNSANLAAGGGPVGAQTFSSAAPFMVPDVRARLRAAMMQAAQASQEQQAQAQSAIMGFGG